MSEQSEQKPAEQGKLRVLLTEREERQLVAGAMIPDEGPLSPAHREAVGAALKAYLEAHKLEPSDVSRGLGGAVCEYTIKQVIQATYAEDALYRRCNAWLETDAKRRGSAVGRTALIMTEPAKQIIQAAQIAHLDECVVLVIGPTGIGKSTTAEVIVERTPGAIGIRAGHYCRTAAGLRNRLAEILGCHRRHRIAKECRSVVDRIIDKLEDSHRLIVLDQGHELTDDGLRFLFEIHDRTGCGVVALCTIDLWQRIQRDADEDHGQLFSRVGAVIEVGNLAGDGKGMGQPLFTRAEIVQLYQTPKVRLLPDAVDYLFAVANMLGKGSLRRCSELMRRAVRRALNEAGGEVVTVSAAMLEATARRYMRQEAGREQIAPRTAVSATA